MITGILIVALSLSSQHRYSKNSGGEVLVFESWVFNIHLRASGV